MKVADSPQKKYYLRNKNNPKFLKRMADRMKTWRNENPEKHKQWTEKWRLNNSSYSCWSAMMHRCYNKNRKSYKKYGGRGIKVCKKWHTFKGFKNSFPERPSLKHSIDRLNNNKDYKPSNCRWATSKQQSLNSSRVKLIRGESLRGWAKMLNIHPETLRYRYKTYGETCLSKNFKIMRGRIINEGC